MSAGAFNSATSTDPSKGTPDSLWSAWRQSCLLVAICFWCHSFLFLSVQLVRQMEPCICHCGSISGLGFLGIISFNGAISLSLSLFFFAWVFPLCAEHLFLFRAKMLWCPGTEKQTKQKPKCSYWALRAEALKRWMVLGIQWRQCRVRGRPHFSQAVAAYLFSNPSPLISSLCLTYLVLLFSSKSGHPVPNFPLANNFQPLIELVVVVSNPCSARPHARTLENTMKLHVRTRLSSLMVKTQSHSPLCPGGR